MRLIVNKKQYNKIIEYQNSENLLFEGITNFIYDNIILYEKKLITETNIRKTNINKKLKNNLCNTINIDIFRGEETIVEGFLNNGLLELDVLLPKTINHNEIKNKLFLGVRDILYEQLKLYGLNISSLSTGDKLHFFNMIDKIDDNLKDKLMFIDADNNYKNNQKIIIDTTKYTNSELVKIYNQLSKNNDSYNIYVDDINDIKNMTINLDKSVPLVFNKKEGGDNNSSTIDDIVTNDDFEEVDIDEVPDGSFTSAIPNKLYPVMYLISDIESGHNYNIQGGEKKPSVTLTDKTIKQVSKGGDYGNNAKGRWQLMPKYMKKRGNNIGLKDTDKFSKINQDKIAISLIKGWKNWDCKKLGDELAKTWAAVPVLYDQQGDVQWVKRGQSYYKGVSSNKALTSADKFESALRKSCSEEDNKKEVTDDTKIELNKRNFHKIPVGDNLWRSGQMTLEELEHVIKTKGIKNIVRMNRHDNKVYGGGSSNGTIVKPEEEKKLAERLGVNYQFISAHKGYQSGKGYVETTNKVQPILNKGNTLIHCTHGADRTGGQVGRFMKDNSNYSEQKLWNYTTQYNGWCNMSKSKFEDGSSTTKGGFDAYAQSFIDDIDYDKMKELCNKSNSEEKKSEKKESPKKDGKIKVLIIGDSHSADVGKNYSRKLLNKEKYSGTILAQVGKKPKWMYDELVKIKNKIKEYDWFIVMGGGNAAYRGKPDIAISNLDKIYKLIKQQKGSDAKIIGITPPHKRFVENKSYPSNQAIADWVISQKPSQLLDVLNLTDESITTKYFEDDALHLKSKLHDIIVQNLEKQIK